MNKITVALLLLMLGITTVRSLEFNQDELIILKGNESQLAADEGYLYLPFQTNSELNHIIIDHVDSGKQMKFKKILSGENHALIKLKAGHYYWKEVRKEIGYYVYRFRYKKDEHQFEVKPGLVNYPGNWMMNLKWAENGGVYATLTNSNKFSYEWIYYLNKYSQYVNNLPMQYVGSVEDQYPQKIKAMLTKYMQVNKNDINYHGLPKKGTPISYFKTTDGVEQQTHEFPNLEKYVKNNDATVGELNPSGQLLLLHNKQEDNYIIEVLNTQTFKSYVIFKQKLHKNSRIENLTWIDHNSFLYTLNYQTISSTHVVHLALNQQLEVTGAQQFEFSRDGVVIDSLIDEENTLLFANFSKDESVKKNGRGLYKVDTTDEKTIKKSFWKTVKHTRQFDYVMQWLTDKNGVVRLAIEVEYDKKEEQFFLHHWFLKQTSESADWVKITTNTPEDDIPLPVLLSEDEGFFYAITNAFGEMKSIHKYSTLDYSYLGPFFEDKEHDITGIKLDPTTKQITAYSYVKNGVTQLNFFNTKDDRIKFLRDKNPEINLFVRQYNQQTGNMLVFGTTTYSKGSWYLYNENSKNISKLMDINVDYENLPKGDTHVIRIKAKDGVDIEGYLVKPSGNTNGKIPLVVIPHGGPIGVRDYADNDELQHFFASQGLATLKVNFRGSGGFGKSFESLGNEQWGEKIESDIHELVLHTIEAHDLNRHKICAMGGSYGGYSALMLTILYPDYYQCAVSMAGVVDLPLMFTGISASAYEEYHETMKKIVGDPIEDHAKLINKSPYYLVEKLTKPIKLFHGQLDDTVSLEQALRMYQALYVLNKNADLTVLENEAHSFKYINSIIFYLAESLKFIQDKLVLPKTSIPYEKNQEEPSASVLDYISEQ